MIDLERVSDMRLLELAQQYKINRLGSVDDNRVLDARKMRLFIENVLQEATK